MRNKRAAQDLSWVFAAYVNEDHPWIEKILQETLKRGKARQFVGYTQAGPADVDRQVEAIYDMLQRSGIKCSSIVTTSAVSDRVDSQHVRFLTDSLKSSQANCIDGTVTMASILRKIAIHSYVILGPGHAMLGYSLTDDPRTGIAALETTMIGTARFAAARFQGDTTFREWTANYAHDPQLMVLTSRNSGGPA